MQSPVTIKAREVSHKGYATSPWEDPLLQEPVVRYDQDQIIREPIDETESQEAVRSPVGEQEAPLELALMFADTEDEPEEERPVHREIKKRDVFSEVVRLPLLNSGKNPESPPLDMLLKGAELDSIRKPMTRHAVFEALVKRSYGSTWAEAEETALEELDARPDEMLLSPSFSSATATQEVDTVEQLSRTDVGLLPAAEIEVLDIGAKESAAGGALRLISVPPPMGPLAKTPIMDRVADLFPDDNLEAVTEDPADLSVSSWAQFLPARAGTAHQYGVPWKNVDSDAKKTALPLLSRADYSEGASQATAAPARSSIPLADGVEPFNLHHVSLITEGVFEGNDGGALEHTGEEILVRLSFPSEHGVPLDLLPDSLEEASELASEAEPEAEPEADEQPLPVVAEAEAFIRGECKGWNRSEIIQLEMKLLSAIRESASAARESAMAVRESAQMARESAKSLRQMAQVMQSPAIARTATEAQPTTETLVQPTAATVSAVTVTTVAQTKKNEVVAPSVESLPQEAEIAPVALPTTRHQTRVVAEADSVIQQEVLAEEEHRTAEQSEFHPEEQQPETEEQRPEEKVIPSMVSASAVEVTLTASRPVAISMEVGGVSVPVENLTMGIYNALGDAVGSVVGSSRKVQPMPLAAPVVERIVQQSSVVPQKKNSHSAVTRSPHEFSARMGGRVVGGVCGVFAGAGSVVIGGKDIVLGIIGCVTGTVGCLTEAVFCVGDTVLGERNVAVLDTRRLLESQASAQ